jgi:plasmid maintenance system antidote protein VapI
MSTELFTKLVAEVFEGSHAKTADAIGLTRSMVSRIASGDRGITPEVAQRLEQVSGGRYRKEQFIWPEESATVGQGG